MDNNKHEFRQEAIDYHKKLRGKIEISIKEEVHDVNELSLAYTPGVAEVSKQIAQDPSLDKILTNKGNTIAIITDGTAVLGLGDIGPAAALPVMEGKAVLFKEFGAVDAYPIVIKETDTQKIIDFVKALEPSFSGINLEDISAPRCFEIERALKKELSIPVFHDDQHGAAIAILAGLINALKVVDKKIQDIKIVINGAGAAGIATSHLLIDYGNKNLILLDKQGVIHPDQVDINEYQKEVAQTTNPSIKTDLQEAIVGADVFIGLSAGNILAQEHVKKMNKDPIIFALANPTPEISPEDAMTAGAKIIATGRSDYPNQINNALIFPGLFRGLLDNPDVKITEKLMFQIAENLANIIESPTPERIITSPFDKKDHEIVARTIRQTKHE